MMVLVTWMMPSFSSLLLITISKVDNAFLASPLLKDAIRCKQSSDISIFKFPNPFGLEMACLSKETISSSSSALRTNTLQRDKRAPLISNDGFSVVAPISIMLPFSTKGKKASCWDLLKRCISSTNRIVFSPKTRLFSACFITSLISLIPLVTAEKSIKEECV